MEIELISCKGVGPEAAARPPLLFIHGSFCGAWVWTEHFMPFFADEGWDCFAVSLRGHGGSGGAMEMAGLGDYVDDAAAALERLDRPPVLVGHSLGGVVAQRLAERQTVAGMVLLASLPPSGLASSALHMARVAPDVLWQVGLLQTMGPRAVDPRAIHRAIFAPGTPEEFGLAYLPRLQGESRRISFDLMGWPWPRRPDPPIPVLVVGGDADLFLPVSAFRETADYYDGELQVLEGVPHGLMLDPCWGDVAEVVRDWLVRGFSEVTTSGVS